MRSFMKLVVIISVLSVTEVSASFYDVFQEAILSVQTSFGKLVSDVVSDVKETVDCTILAVEHVLSLTDDATDRYYEKCKTGIDPNTSSDEYKQNYGPSISLPKVEISVEMSNEDLKKSIPAEISAAFNDSVSKIINSYNVKDKIHDVEDVLAKESDYLDDVTVSVNQEFDKLSNEINNDFSKNETNNSQISFENVLDKVKILQDREHNDNNASESKKIHQVINKVLDKLGTLEATEATETIRLEETLKDMESHSNNSFADLEKQFDDWKEENSKYLNDIKDAMEEEKEIAKNNTVEDIFSRRFEDNSNSTNKAQLNNTANIVMIPKLVTKYSYNKTTDTGTEYAFNMTDNQLKVTAGITTTNETELFSNISDKFNISTTNYLTLETFTEDPNKPNRMQLGFGVNDSSISTVITTTSFESATIIPVPTTQDAYTDYYKTSIVTENINLDTTNPMDEYYAETSTIESVTDTYILQFDYLRQTQPVSSNNEERANETSTIYIETTTYDPTPKDLVLTKEIYSPSEKEQRTNQSESYMKNVFITSLTTSESSLDTTIVSDDFTTLHGPSYNLTNRHDVQDQPSINTVTESVTFDLDQNKTTRRLDEGSQVESSILKSMFGQQDNSTVVYSNEVNNISTVLTTVKPVTTAYSTSNVRDKTELDYEAFFNSETKHSPVHKKAIKDAKKIIEDSRWADSIMKSILKNKKRARNIFTYPRNLR